MQMLFQNEHLYIAIFAMIISTLVGLAALLMALLREFSLSFRLSFVCVAASILPAAALNLKSGRSIVFEQYEAVAFPSLIGLAAIGVCLLYTENRNWQDYQYTISHLITWLTIIALILGCLTWLL